MGPATSRYGYRWLSRRQRLRGDTGGRLAVYPVRVITVNSWPTEVIADHLARSGKKTFREAAPNADRWADDALASNGALLINCRRVAYEHIGADSFQIKPCVESSASAVALASGACIALCGAIAA